MTQHPAGFADLVTKVKPAVISVRVKIEASADPAMMQENSDDGDDQQQVPAQPGSPFDKFFQQFGDQFGPRWRPRSGHGSRSAMRPSPAKAPASSSRPTAMR